MGVEYNWREEDWDAAPAGPQRPGPRHWGRWSLFVLLAALLLMAGGGWLQQTQRAARERAQRADVQALLAEEAALLAAGELSAATALLSANPAWRSAQFQPVQASARLAGRRVGAVVSQADMVQADILWQADGVEWRQLGFFERDVRGQLRYASPGDSPYWGTNGPRSFAWGDLITYPVDAEWAAAIAQTIAAALAESCGFGCPRLTVNIRSDFVETAVPGLVYMPSPQIWALDTENQPAPAYFAELGARVADAAGPAHIRFAIPGVLYQQLDYAQAVRDFMAVNPQVTVELVVVEATDDVPALLTTVDGAALTPTTALVAAGLVRDVTDYAFSDPTFDQQDYYEQIWQGAWWQDRLWFLPQAGQLNAIFLDRATYEARGRPLPSLRWTWDEMAEEAAALSGEDRWGIMDVGQDLLLAHLYANTYDCAGTFTIYCDYSPTTADITATLSWYDELVAAGSWLDLTGLTGAERLSRDLNVLSSRRRVGIWAASSTRYEYHLLLNSLTVLPFPATGEFNSITPLWLHGHVIAGASARPRAVWTWLSFLSHQSLRPRHRLIPARPTLAGSTNYWTTLPRPLADVMRLSFPFARPVTLADMDRFSWAQLAALGQGVAPAVVAGQRWPADPIAWPDPRLAP